MLSFVRVSWRLDLYVGLLYCFLCWVYAVRRAVRFPVLRFGFAFAALGRCVLSCN